MPRLEYIRFVIFNSVPEVTSLPMLTVKTVDNIAHCQILGSLSDWGYIL